MIPLWLLIIYTSYGIPCLLLYITVLGLLLKPSLKLYFKSSFFIIAIVMAFVDILCYIIITIFFKWPLCPSLGPFFVYLETSYILALFQFLQHFFITFHGLLITLTSINRMTSMAFPRDHEKIWSIVLWPGIIISGILSAIPTWHLLFSKISLAPFNERVSMDAVFVVAKHPIFSTAFNQSIAFAVISISGLFFNFLCIFFLIKVKALTTQKLISKTEIRLVFVSLWDFILEVMFCSHQITMFILGQRKLYDTPIYETLYLQVPWLFDVITLSRPFLLLMMSQQLRSSFLNLFFKEKVAVAEPSTMPTGGRKTVRINPVVTKF